MIMKLEVAMTTVVGRGIFHESRVSVFEWTENGRAKWQTDLTHCFLCFPPLCIAGSSLFPPYLDCVQVFCYPPSHQINEVNRKIQNGVSVE